MKFSHAKTPTAAEYRAWRRRYARQRFRDAYVWPGLHVIGVVVAGVGLTLALAGGLRWLG